MAWIFNLCSSSHQQLGATILHGISRMATAIVVTLVVVGVIAAVSRIETNTHPAPAVQPTITSSGAHVYLLSAVGACKGPAGYTPCFGGDVTQAEIFNCASAAASASGCAKLVVDPTNPQLTYHITVWYPYADDNGGTFPANCRYESSGDPTHYYYAYCIPLNATSFIVTEPSPPPLGIQQSKTGASNQ